MRIDHCCFPFILRVYNSSLHVNAVVGLTSMENLLVSLLLLMKMEHIRGSSLISS